MVQQRTAAGHVTVAHSSSSGSSMQGDEKQQLSQFRITHRETRSSSLRLSNMQPPIGAELVTLGSEDPPSAASVDARLASPLQHAQPTRPLARTHTQCPLDWSRTSRPKSPSSDASKLTPEEHLHKQSVIPGAGPAGPRGPAAGRRHLPRSPAPTAPRVSAAAAPPLRAAAPRPAAPPAAAPSPRSAPGPAPRMSQRRGRRPCVGKRHPADGSVPQHLPAEKRLGGVPKHAPAGKRLGIVPRATPEPSKGQSACDAGPVRGGDGAQGGAFSYHRSAPLSAAA